MKKNKVSSMLYFPSILFYVSAIFSFVNDDTSMGVVWLALGSSFLCLGSVHGRKANGSDSKNDKAD